MKIELTKLGQEAEDLAVLYFTKRDFVIIARNYRYRRAEVDLIVQKEKLLVFVEVKARSNNQFGEPETFVNRKQQTGIHTAAEYYIITQDWDHAIRFDIIAISRNHNYWQLTHFEDAF